MHNVSSTCNYVHMHIVIPCLLQHTVNIDNSEHMIYLLVQLDYLLCLHLHMIFFFFNDTATTEIYTLSHTTLFRSNSGVRPLNEEASARTMRNWRFTKPINKIKGIPNMGAIFTSPGRTVTAGVVLIIAIVIVVGLITGQMTKVDHAYATFIMRWLHVISGVLWIGLLWYLNFVQVPTMPTIQPVESRTAITKFIAPNVLFYFRYAALATVITGVLLAWMLGYIVQALTLRPGFVMIGIGMWMALVMAFNVWFIIWPNQQKILGLVEATAEQKAAAAKPALYASRFNTMFSIGMLYCMVAQQNAPV